MRTVADLFCGTGGLSHGFVRTGEFQTVLGVDIKRDAIETFSANNPKAVALADDIRKLRAADLSAEVGLGPGELDLMVGGPPCQGFSSLRPYRSINENDARNTLFEQFVVLVGFFKPRWVVLENVVGLLHHKGGSTIRSIEEAFSSVGYATNVRVLNAVHYGVPQKRERVFLLARRGALKPELPRPRHFFNGKSMAGHRAVRIEPLFDDEAMPPITVGEAIGDLPPVKAGEGATGYLNQASPYAKARRKDASQLTLHSATAHTDKMLEIIRHAGANRWALPEGMTTSGFSSCYSRLDADEPSTTITVNFVHPASNRCIHPTQDRALTPRGGGLTPRVRR